MIDSTKDLNFTDYNGYKVVGTHSNAIAGNALINKSATEIIIPEKYFGVKVREIGQYAFGETKIESIFISRYIKTILWAAFWNCKSLKYITFDANSELETTNNKIIAYTIIESINMPLSLKSFDASASTFLGNSKLTCFSYLGNLDLSYQDFIKNSPSSLVAHAMSSYSYNFSKYSPIKDSQKCPEKIFPNQLIRRNRLFSCNRRINRISYSIFNTLLISP